MAKIIGIYNAKGGIMHGAFDFLHKSFSPSTYKCELCAITYGATGMKKTWRSFLESLDSDFVFYHKNDMPKYLQKYATNLPIMLLEKKHSISTLLTKQEMQNVENIQELMNVVTEKLM